jgi:hypothetical protein
MFQLANEEPLEGREVNGGSISKQENSSEIEQSMSKPSSGDLISKN